MLARTLEKHAAVVVNSYDEKSYGPKQLVYNALHEFLMGVPGYNPIRFRRMCWKHWR